MWIGALCAYTHHTSNDLQSDRLHLFWIHDIECSMSDVRWQYVVWIWFSSFGLFLFNVHFIVNSFTNRFAISLLPVSLFCSSTRFYLRFLISVFLFCFNNNIYSMMNCGAVRCVLWEVIGPMKCFADTNETKSNSIGQVYWHRNVWRLVT